MNVSISRLSHVASLIAFAAAAFGNTVFGNGGLELVAAGLALYVGGDIAETVLSD